MSWVETDRTVYDYDDTAPEDIHGREVVQINPGFGNEPASSGDSSVTVRRV